MHVEVKDPDDKEILSRVYSAEGMSKHLYNAWQFDWQMNKFWKIILCYYRKVPIHITHSWWTYHLFVFKHLTMVQWITVACPFRYSSWWTCCRLRSSRTKRKTHRIAIAYPTITQSSWSNHQRTKLPTGNYHYFSSFSRRNFEVFLIVFFNCFFFYLTFIVSRRTFPSNQRKYKQTSIVVVIGPSIRSSRYGLLANASS